MNAVLVFAAVVVAAPALKEPKKENALVGRWKCQELVTSGQPSPGNEDLEYEFTADGKWVIYRQGNPLTGADRTYKPVEDGKTKGIDLSEVANPYPGLFKVEGDTLTLIFRHAGLGRPAGFDDAEGTMRFTMSRVKR